MSLKLPSHELTGRELIGAIFWYIKIVQSTDAILQGSQCPKKDLITHKSSKLNIRTQCV